ncbi:MAG: hypothetical protein R8K48_09055 [Gallionella sp.]
MQKSTIEDLKVIASFHKLGYQTLMKQVIQRFVDCEKNKYGVIGYPKNGASKYPRQSPPQSKNKVDNLED